MTRSNLYLAAVSVLLLIATQACTTWYARELQVTGAVIGVVDPQLTVSGISKPFCEDRLLLRVAKTGGAFTAGEYLVLQYDKPPRPCELPGELFNGHGLWQFELQPQPAGRDSLRKLLGVWDMGEPQTFDTPYGRISTVRYLNLQMLDGSRVDDLPLDSVVREFRFRPDDKCNPCPVRQPDR